MIGTYSITNKLNGRIYIGSSVNTTKRWYEHLWSLGQNQHRNQQLQYDWNHQQEHDFEFAIIQQCKASELRELETQTIREMQHTHNLYNRYEADQISAQQARARMTEADWNDFTTTDKAAQTLKISRRTIVNMIERGIINAYKLDPTAKSVYRIPRAEIDRLLRERNTTPDARE